MMKSVLTRIVAHVSIFKLEPLKGCFQILISLRSPELLCFNHWFHSLCHGLNHWSNTMLWQSNFILSIWHKSPYLITISGMDRLGFMHCPLHLTLCILDEVNIRRSWWPVNEFDVGLQQDPFLNDTTIVSGGVVLKLGYSSGIKHSYRGHHYVLRTVRVQEAIQVTLYMMEHLSPFMGDPVATVNRHTNTAFRGCCWSWFETRSQICSVGR
jgi:hypothetical protein